MLIVSQEHTVILRGAGNKDAEEVAAEQPGAEKSRYPLSIREAGPHTRIRLVNKSCKIINIETNQKEIP